MNLYFGSMKSKEGQKYATENMIADYKSIKDLGYVQDVSISSNSLRWWDKVNS